jgi:hypothetical protein
MRAIKLVALLAGTLASLPVWAQPASPVDPPVNLATNRPAYLTQIKHVGGPGLLPANFAYVTLGTNKFGFVMPDGYRLETQDRQKVTLVSADLNCLLTFRVVETEPARDTEPDAAYYRDLLLSRHPGGKITDEFSLAAVSRRGPAFDLRWNAAGTVPRLERALFISCDAGLLEFSLVSSLEKFEAGRQALRAFLITFRTAEPDGRLNMPVLSDRL